MHVPDGFLDAPTSVGTGVVAAGVVAACLVRSARHELTTARRRWPGWSPCSSSPRRWSPSRSGRARRGHLLGGVLAAVLVGPATATLCLTVVVTVQALLFADGGVSALGTNVLLMGVVGGVGRLRGLPGRAGRAAQAALQRQRRGRRRRPRLACRWPRWRSSGSTPSAAPPPSRSAQLAAAWPAGTSLIGVGEAVITVLAVVERRRRAARPRPRRPPGPPARALELRTPEPRRVSTRRLVVARAARQRPASPACCRFYASGQPRRADPRRPVASASPAPREAPPTRARRWPATASRASTTRGSPVGSPGWSASPWSGWSWPGVVLLLRRRSPPTDAS